MSLRTILVLATTVLSVSACSNETAPTDLYTKLSHYCGQSFEGTVTSDDPRDADWAAETLTIEFRECDMGDIRIPLHVGENRSRTWVITRIEDGLRLQHDHRHEDGSSDVLTMYGGDTLEEPTATQAHFPADQHSKDLFEREGIPDSMQNTWSLTLNDTHLVYALDRPNRHFEASFDLTQTVATPPAPWAPQ
jgi:hypothetical protein